MKEIFLEQSASEVGFVIGISLLFLSLLIIIEIKKKRKTRLVLRILLLIIITFSLALILLRPSVKSEKSKVTAVLLTDDYNHSVLDSVINVYSKEIKLFSFNSINVNTEVSAAVSMAQIAHDNPEIDTLFIIGNAFYDWDKNYRYPFKIFPLFNDLPDGIVDMHIANQFYLHGMIEVAGKYQNSTDSLITLIFESPAGKVDSVAIPRGASYFVLNDKPKVEGSFLYSLVEKGKGLIAGKTYQIPIIVKPFEALDISIHSSSPSFEIKFLKNWLGSVGHRITIKTQISKKIYYREKINRVDEASLEFTEERLKESDIVILDGQVLSTLSDQTLQLLENAVENEALGVLILGSEAIIRKRNQRSLDFFMNFDFGSGSNAGILYKKAINKKNIQAEINKLPYEIAGNMEVSPSIRTVMAKNYYNAGKVGFLLATDTYSLKLSGKDDLYTELWSDILNEMLPDYKDGAVWEMDDVLNFRNYPIQFHLLNYSNIPEAVITDAGGEEFAVYMMQNPNISDKWSGTFWPLEGGWYDLKLRTEGDYALESEIIKHFYVQEDSSWQTFSLSRAYGRFYENIVPLNSESLNISPVIETIEIERIYFFVFFLLSCSLLWVEQKL